MRAKFKIIVYVLLICLYIGILAGCSANRNEGSSNYEDSDNYEDYDNYEWYIKIYMPGGCVEGPGKVMYVSTTGLMTVEIDGIQYKVGTQNILVRKLPEP